MSETRTTRLKFSYAESKVTYEGAVEFEILGYTEGGKSHKIVLCMGPSSIGFIADELHAAAHKYQETLDQVKKRLRGE